MARTGRNSTARAIGLALLALLAGGIAWADERPHWEFEVAPYAWIPGNFGTATVKGRTANIDVSVRDALDLATSGNAFTAAGYFSIAYDRWSVFADAFGGYAEASVSETIPTRFCTASVAGKAKIKPVLADFALGYRLGQWSLPGRRRPLTVGVYAGARYSFTGIRLNASAGVGGSSRSDSVSRSFSWADPMIGVRWEVPVFDRVSLDFRGDIGGFGASSDLIWGLVGGARYWLPWTPWSTQPWLGAGYRAAAFDRTSGADSLDLQFRGPTGGMGFVF
jgi:hypothetical protein